MAGTTNEDGVIVPASTILALIEDGKSKPIQYKDKIITGNFDLTTVKLERTRQVDRNNVEGEGLGLSETVSEVASPITFSNCEFREVVIFRNIYFEKEIKLERVLFCKNADFRGAIFGNDVSFRDSIFKLDAEFGNACFGGIADFTSVRFLVKNIRFDAKVKFKKEAKFFNTIFLGVSNFKDCEFQGGPQRESALFTGARFLKEVYFNHAKFADHTDFRLVEFRENTYFNDAIFLGPVGFAETIFRKDADFRKVTFDGDYGNFRATEFFGEFISFRKAKFRNLCDQAVACRKARKQLENSGRRGEADHNFFMEMDAQRRRNGITEVKPGAIKRILQPEMKLLSDFSEEFIKEGASWKDRLAIISQFVVYNFIGFKLLLLKFSEELNKREESGKKISLQKRSSIIYHFMIYNIFEYILARHIFGGYGIFWWWIFIWWIIFAVAFGFIYRFGFNGIDGAKCTLQCIFFSILVIFTRGLGTYQLALSALSFEDQIIAFETILGLMMFGLFLASITRRYMR